MTHWGDLEGLLAAKADADAAVAEAEQQLLDELAAAKDAHRDDPTPESKDRRDAVAADVRAYREATRAFRTSLVGGDATTGQPTDDGSEG